MEKAEILRQTNGGLDVFRHYVPGQWNVGKLFKNPFYHDTHASFNIYYDKHSATYRMKDFGNPDYDGDCFTLVAMLNGRNCTDKEDFVTVMDTITHDMNLFLSTKSKAGHACAPSTVIASAVRSSSTGMRINERAFTASELDWWKAYGITPDVLARYRVTAVSDVEFANGARLVATAELPVFSYRFHSGEECTQKLYSPYSSRNRFMYPKKVDGQLFGYDRLPPTGEAVVLTGGEKDVLTVSSLGIPAFCLNSETATLDEALLTGLRERFQKVIVLYDTDETGLRASEKLWKLHSLHRIVLPLEGSKTEKDISDYVKKELVRGLSFEEITLQFRAWVDECKSAVEEAQEPYLIRLDVPPAQPYRVLSMGFQSVASAGGLVCITGGPGTGKSNYAGAIVSGTLHTVLEESIDTLGIQVSPNVERKAVLLFDTEQSNHQSFDNLKRVLARAGVARQPDYLQVMNLCRMPRSERQAFIEKSLEYAAGKYNGIYCMVIDGLADLIGSANDEDEAVRIVEWAQGLAEKYQMVLISIVHTAGLPEKVRGHLGSELTRKASAVIDIETDKKSGNSLVKVLKLREGSAAQAGMCMFGWDEKVKMHVTCA
ncbi:MAG: AAA family ATPase [Bacteroides sp.]|nr:AAA family ATPase [Bacteroides sp.]